MSLFGNIFRSIGGIFKPKTPSGFGGSSPSFGGLSGFPLPIGIASTVAPKPADSGFSLEGFLGKTNSVVNAGVNMVGLSQTVKNLLSSTPVQPSFSTSDSGFQFEALAKSRELVNASGMPDGKLFSVGTEVELSPSIKMALFGGLALLAWKMLK